MAAAAYHVAIWITVTYSNSVEEIAAIMLRTG